MSLQNELQDLAIQIDGGDRLPADWTPEQRAAWYESAKRMQERDEEHHRQKVAWLDSLQELLGGEDALMSFLQERIRVPDPTYKPGHWMIESAMRDAREEGREITEEEAAWELWREGVDHFVHNQVVANRTQETVIADERYRW